MRTKPSLRVRFANLRHRFYYPHPESTPIEIAALLALACWIVVWGCRLIASVGGFTVMQAIRHHTGSPDAVAMLSLYCSALLAFSQFYYRPLLQQYAPVVQKRLFRQRKK